MEISTNKNINWKKLLIGDDFSLANLSENKRTFKQSLLENWKWILLLEIFHWLDVLVLTRVALSYGFTEKGLATAKVIEINYWLGGMFSIVTILGFMLFFVFMKWKFAIIGTCFIMFGTIVANYTLLRLFYDGMIIPF